MINLSRDIQSLSTFKRNTNELISQMKETGNPIVLTVNGKADYIIYSRSIVNNRKLLTTAKNLFNPETLSSQHL
jgi:prevent-host-death family protein